MCVEKIEALPDSHTRVAETAFERHSNRGVLTERDRVRHEAIRASYPPRRPADFNLRCIGAEYGYQHSGAQYRGEWSSQQE
jgi:hypothetical protein